MGRKLGAPPLFGGGELDPISHKVAWADAYLHTTVFFSYTVLHTKWHFNPSSRLATTNMGRKLGVCAPFGETELGFHLTQCGQGRGLPA